MLNNVNTFNSAKISEIANLFQGADSDKIKQLTTNLIQLQRGHNSLIDILQRQIKILQASVANGISVDSTGSVSLGLATTTVPGALSATDWGTFNNKASKEESIVYAIALGG
jgi:hypothetical protein